jgi:hypothetical protein
MLDASRGRSTRSQITLPSAILDDLSLEQSPLKVARTAARNKQSAPSNPLPPLNGARTNISTHDQASGTQASGTMRPEATSNESDDELLLSPRSRIPQKRTTPEPRSPTMDENGQERNTKRARRNSNANGRANGEGQSAHSFTGSKVLDLNALGRRPFPAQDEARGRTFSALEGSPSRARSVPAVPYLDLTAIAAPPSPWRKPLSPGKNTVRIASVPPTPPIGPDDDPLQLTEVETVPVTPKRPHAKVPSFNLGARPHLPHLPESTTSTVVTATTTSPPPNTDKSISPPMSPLTPVGVTPAVFKRFALSVPKQDPPSSLKPPREVAPTPTEAPPPNAFAFPESSSPLTEAAKSSEENIPALNVGQQSERWKPPLPHTHTPSHPPPAMVAPSSSRVPRPKARPLAPSTKTSTAIANMVDALLTPEGQSKDPEEKPKANGSGRLLSEAKNKRTARPMSTKPKDTQVSKGKERERTAGLEGMKAMPSSRIKPAPDNSLCRNHTATSSTVENPGQEASFLLRSTDCKLPGQGECGHRCPQVSPNHACQVTPLYIDALISGLQVSPNYTGSISSPSCVSCYAPQTCVQQRQYGRCRCHPWGSHYCTLTFTRREVHIGPNGD